MMKHYVILICSLLVGISVRAQSPIVTGKISDGSGAALSGVSITEQGAGRGTVSDVNGDYRITVETGQPVLLFSYMGMESLEIAVAGRSRIDVQLQPSSAIDMDEVVVVGYGVQRKSDVVSSVVSVNTESVNKVPSNDLGEMLRGKAPGVYVSLADGAPGGSSNILIRGNRSLTAGNAPIVIADGVPIGGINDINPNDIASIEILKDAAAQAIYGARAANGVILITTKRGEAGKTTIDVSSFYGAQTVRRNFDVYSGEEFAQLKREAYRADNNDYLPDEAIFTAIEQEVMASGAYIDWEDELLRTAATQNHNVNVSTGTEKTRIYSGFNYSLREGVIPGTDFQRGTIRLNLDQTINSWLKLGANTSWQLSKNNNPGTGETLLRSITTSPLGKIYNDDGTYRIYPTGVQESINPLLDLAEVSNTRHDRNDIMNIFADITPFEGFHYRVNASRRSWNRKTMHYATAESLLGYRRGGMGNGAIQYEDESEWQLENIVSYERGINRHNLNGTFVHSISQRRYNRFRNDASNIPNDLLGVWGLPSAERNLPTVGANDRALLSFVGRVQYDYDGKYLVTASARADGSTVFGTNNKWAYFPAVAIGWNMYRESFIEAIPEISNLKLRASYGSVGNEAINAYQSLSTAVQRDYLFGGVKRIGYVPGDFLPNPDLKWETSTTLNTAIDFGFFKNRLSGTVEYYNTRTTDLLAQLSLQADVGYSRMLRNIGEVENQGVELNISGVLVDKTDLTVNAGFSFSHNRNKIISLYGDVDENGNELDDLANGWFIGRSRNVSYQYVPEGIWQIGENIVNSHMPMAQPGDVKLRDANGDGILGDADRVIIDRDPKWFGTFNFDVRYKGIDLSADVVAVQGVKRNNAFLYDYSMGGSLRGILNGVKVDYWTPENPTGNWPRPQESNDRTYIWTMGIQDASFVRLHTLTLGYTFSSAILSRLKMHNLRIYCTGHNLVTLTDFKSYSPEKNPNDYPEAVSIVGGIQVNF